MEKPQTKLFIFDDDLSLITLLQRIAQPRFSRIHTAPSCRRALDLVNSDVEDFDLIITDLNFPDGNGMDILRAVKNKAGHAAVVVFTGFASLETAIQAMHEGAYDYVTKPFTVEQILALFNKMESHVALQWENIQLRLQLEKSGKALSTHAVRYEGITQEFQLIHQTLRDHGEALKRIVTDIESLTIAIRSELASKH